MKVRLNMTKEKPLAERRWVYRGLHGTFFICERSDFDAEMQVYNVPELDRSYYSTDLAEMITHHTTTIRPHLDKCRQPTGICWRFKTGPIPHFSEPTGPMGELLERVRSLGFDERSNYERGGSKSFNWHWTLDPEPMIVLDVNEFPGHTIWFQIKDESSDHPIDMIYVGMTNHRASVDEAFKTFQKATAGARPVMAYEA